MPRILPPFQVWFARRRHALRAWVATVSIGSLIAGSMVGVALVGASTLAGPASVAQADPPPTNLPTSIVLSSNEGSFAAGSSATLTATTDADVAGTSSTITITDETTSSTIATCTTGLTCTVGTSFLTGGPHTYVATVNDLTSNEVTVQREAWSVSLTSDKSVFSAGEYVTLTATANQNVGSTSGNYQLRIFDTTTGETLTGCSSGLTCTTTSTFPSGAAHSYIAEVSTAPWPSSLRTDTTDLQAASDVVTVGRATWTVSLSANKTVIAAGEYVTLTSSTSQDVGSTGGIYTTRIFDLTTGLVLTSCSSGTTCTVPTTFYSGPAHSFIAEVAAARYPGSPRADTYDVQATSNTIAVSRQAWSVSLSSNKSTFEAGESVTLTAVANQDPGNSSGQYRIRIFDTTTGYVVASCDSGLTCSGISTFPTGGPHTYVAAVSSAPWPGSAQADTYDVQASSDNVVVSRDTWTLTLTSNKTVFAAGGEVTLTATSNQDVGGTTGSYAIRIFDTTTNTVVASCTTGTSCSGTSSFPTGGPHTYVASVATAPWPASLQADTYDVQVTSNTVSASREVWVVSLSADKTVFAAGDRVTFTATANQHVEYLGGGYGIRIFDATTGQSVATCTTGTTCTGTDSFDTGGAHTYVAEVAFAPWPGSAQGVATDIQAFSNTATASRELWTVTLSSNRTEFAAGSSVTFTATANQNVGLTDDSYVLRIFDVTTGDVLVSCDDGTVCTGTAVFYTGGAHTYRAVVSSTDGPYYAPYPDVIDVQARSNSLSAARKAWTIGVTTTSHSYVEGSIAYLDTHLHASTNQDVGNTNGKFFITFYDWTTSTFLTSCGDGDSCDYTYTAVLGTPPDSYMALVMPSDAGLAAPSAYEATSNGYSRDTGVGAVLPGESIGGANPAEKNSCGCAHGDPINTETGEFDLTVTDDGIPGAGPALAVERSYSSTAAAGTGSFGHGWSANFNAKLLVLAVGNVADPLPRRVQITQENGSTVAFTENPDGTYSAPARVAATLAWNPTSNQWTYTRNLREVMLFDTDGELVASQDLNGNSVNYGYTAGVVTSISGSGGRSITLTWGGGHVTGITDSAGRTASYSYDPAGDLTSVTGVDSTVNTYGYDADHLMTTTEKPNGGTTTNIYDSSHRVVLQEDPADRVTTFNYLGDTTYTVAPDSVVTVEIYGSGLLTSQTRAAGTSYAETTQYTYDSNNDIASITDQLGNITNYTYDANSDVLTETDPLSRTTTWTYDGLGDILTVTDPLDRESIATYDSAGNELTATSPGGAIEHWTYNANGTLATSEDARGKTTTYGHNPAGDLTSSTDPDGRTNAQTFNSAGFVTSSTDPAGNVTTVTSDAAGRTLTVTDPNSHTTTYGYDGDGNRTSAETASGHTTTYAYDGDGNRTSAETASGHTTTYAYDLADELTSTTVPGSNTTTYAYTGNGWLSTTTDPNSHVTSTTYNSLGLPTSVTNGDGKTTNFGYDSDGRQTTVTLPAGDESTTTYDNAGQRLTSTDPSGKTTTYGYDVDGELTSVTDPLGRVTTSTYTPDAHVHVVTMPNASTEVKAYNADGQLTDFTNADGQHTTYSYDDAGLPTSKTEPGSLTTSYSYTSAGQLHVITNPDATTITDGYNAGGLLTGVAYSAASSANVSYTYTADDLRATMTDATGTSTYTYDNRDLLTSQTNGAGATIGYGYDAAGQLTSMTYPGDKTVSYAYDGAGQMSSLTDSASNETGFTWTDDGQLATQSDPNGVTQTRSYDANDRTTGISTAHGSTTLANYTYGYDDNGEVTSASTIDPNNTTAVSHTYNYNNLTQLTTVNDGTTATSYSSTPGGSLTSNSAGSSLTYNTGGQLTALTPVAGPATTFLYDANGDRTSSTVAATGTTPASTTSYGYDAAGNLASVAMPAAGSSAAETVGYTSDGDGLRQSRTVGTTTTNFTWATLGSLPLMIDDGTYSYLYGPSSAPIAEINDSTGAIHYLTADLVGSTRLITSSLGAVTGVNTYDEYGNLTTHTGASTSAFGYSGNWTDPDTGLIYLRARDYDPVTAQFLTVDPLIDSTRQPYAYVGNDPLSRTDSTGCDWLSWTDGAAHFFMKGPGAHVASVLEGIGDSASFGLTQKVRELMGTDCQVQKDGFYFTGIAVGTFASFVAGGAIAKGAMAVVGGAGKLLQFGRTASEASEAAIAASDASEVSVSASSIRFSQSSVNGAAAIAKSMKSAGWVGKAIDVVKMDDGGLTAVDNTRVLAARMAGIGVSAVIHGADDAMDAGQAARFLSRAGETPQTWGQAVLNRIMNQNSAFRNAYPSGSNITGWIGN